MHRPMLRALKLLKHNNSPFKRTSDASPDVEGIETTWIRAGASIVVSNASPDIEGIETTD